MLRRRLGEALGDHAAQADDLHFLGAVARLARGVGARVHRRRRAARGARGQRGVDVARLDAARGPVPDDGSQVESGLGGAAARGRRRHDATRPCACRCHCRWRQRRRLRLLGWLSRLVCRVARRCGVSGSARRGRRRLARRARRPTAAEVASVSNTTSSEPTATMSPGWPVMERMRPVTGAGISTAAFSVMTSHMTWSSCTRSPGFTCQATTSAETVPSPRSGILNT